MKAKIMRIMVMAGAAAWLAGGCASTGTPPPVVDRKVDLERFMGPWHVVAGQFTWLERHAWNGIESYELEPDGTIATTYTFRKGAADGPLKSYHPSAIVYDRETNAVWGMRFLWPFRATFLILFLDDEYRYTVIGEPDRKYLWIMSRTPSIPDEVMQGIERRMREIGYDPAQFKRMPQVWPETPPRPGMDSD